MFCYRPLVIFINWLDVLVLARICTIISCNNTFCETKHMHVELYIISLFVNTHTEVRKLTHILVHLCLPNIYTPTPGAFVFTQHACITHSCMHTPVRTHRCMQLLTQRHTPSCHIYTHAHAPTLPDSHTHIHTHACTHKHRQRGTCTPTPTHHISISIS